ncbi:DUF11 domain-containing protein [Arenibacter sp. 6A1]|uniref:DUF11 domain-containing protein n=1 Tax=Arenibacter sp. 6A1 TaxID=2720391 RepID=UPI0014479115|nr:DUF11 domain-containing protein [Arenibacter sp. 6A1]NKI25990.1 DUF11 domain-containing protein [Arenibacter sp. 6A1]
MNKNKFIGKPVISFFLTCFLFINITMAFSAHKISGLIVNPLVVQDVDLELEMTVDNPTADIGTVVNFTIAINNNGPGDATNIEILASLPNGYAFINASSTKGNYDALSGVWIIKQLPKSEKVLLTVTATLLNYEGSLYLAEIMICDQDDTDSIFGNGVDTDGDGEVVDDPDDEDDGDGQDIKNKIKSEANDETTFNSKKAYTSPEDCPTGIRMLLTDHKNRIQTYFFDHNAIAMRVEFDPKEKQKPMFFDNDGYVYTYAKKQGYYKTPFAKMMKLLKNMNSSLIDNADNNYGIDVGPNKFPVLEWAFTYYEDAFRNRPEITEQTVAYQGDNNSTKFTLNSGDNQGSFIIFDSQGRLRIIETRKQGKAEYFYENHNVTIPPSQEAPGLFNLFGG